MLALIKKDLRLHAKLLLIYTVTITFVLWVMTDFQIPIGVALFLAFFMIRNRDGVEESNHSVRLIQSMPVSRSEVIWAKHLFDFGYIFILSSAVFLLNGFLPQLRANGLGDLILVWSMGLFMVSGYNLLYLIVGPRWMNIAFIVIALFFITFGWTIVRSAFFTNLIHFFQNTDSLLIHTMVAGSSLMLSAGFIIFSQGVYKKKEL